MAFKDQILIYTDGACTGNPGPGGWAAIVCLPSGQVTELAGSEPSTTNNRMELQGTIAALTFVADHKLPVRLYTDSTYVIRGITQWVFGWQRKGWKSQSGNDVANQDLWENLLRIVRERGKGAAIDWQYVRGHSGVAGNERCDELAVAFANRAHAELYTGPAKQYHFDLGQLPPDEPLPEMKSGTSEKKVAYGYLSLIGTVACRHATWPECERRVKGQSGAKFKKVMSEAEEKSILQAWGVDPKNLK